MAARTRAPIPPELMRQAASIMRAIAHPVRLRILEILGQEGEANVSTLREKTGALQPVVSQQLARLRLEGVLARRRAGTSVFYRVARREVLGVLDCIRKMGERHLGGAKR